MSLLKVGDTASPAGEALVAPELSTARILGRIYKLRNVACGSFSDIGLQKSRLALSARARKRTWALSRATGESFSP